MFNHTLRPLRYSKQPSRSPSQQPTTRLSEFLAGTNTMKYTLTLVTFMIQKLLLSWLAHLRKQTNKQNGMTEMNTYEPDNLINMLIRTKLFNTALPSKKLTSLNFLNIAKRHIQS